MVLKTPVNLGKICCLIFVWTSRFLSPMVWGTGPSQKESGLFCGSKQGD